MNISNRTSLLIELSKTATEPKAYESPDTKPFSSVKERAKRLEELRDAFKDRGQRTYTAEQEKLMLSYTDLIDNFESYGEYIYEPLQKLGNDITNRIMAPFRDELDELKQGATKDGMDVGKASREKAKRDIKNAKGSLDLEDFRYFKKTYSALQNNELHKIASPDIILADASDAFEKEFDKSIDSLKEKFDAEYSYLVGNENNLNLDFYNKTYHLAVAHHVLTKEGCLKEASNIDEFILKNAGFWGNLWDGVKETASSAWNATKKVVSKGLELAGKAASGILHGIKWVGAKGLKLLKFLGSKIPYLGIIFSIPFCIKNSIEAYKNAKRIISGLDLPKYGFNRAYAITPAGVGHVRKTYKKALEKHRANPDNLKELLVIFRTIGAFWIDFLFALTNLFMAILDAIAIAGLFFGPPGWLISIGALGADWLLMIGVGALEIGAEYFKDEYWDKDINLMLDVAEEELNKLVKAGKIKKTKYSFGDDAEDHVIETSEAA